MYDVVLAKLVLDAFELQTKLLMHIRPNFPAREIMDLQIQGHERVYVHWYHPENCMRVHETIFFYDSSNRKLSMDQNFRECLFPFTKDSYALQLIGEFYKRNVREVVMSELFQPLITA